MTEKSGKACEIFGILILLIRNGCILPLLFRLTYTMVVVDVFYRPFLKSWIALMRNSKPILVLMAGLSGTGKSTLAKELSRQLRWHHIYKDGLREILITKGSLDEEKAGDLAFDQALDIACRVLKEEKASVILDSSIRFPSMLKSAQGIVSSIPNAQLKIILCYADKALRVIRRQGRNQAYDSDVDPDTREEYMELFKHLPENRLELDTAEPLEACFAKAMDYLMS
jgi:predicted kinase